MTERAQRHQDESASANGELFYEQYIDQVDESPEDFLATDADITAPETDPNRFSIVVVDQSQDARDMARDTADARLNQELNQGGKLSRFMKGIWKGNIAKDYYRQKYIREAQQRIEETQDVLVHEDIEDDARSRAIGKTIERFQHEYSGLVHETAGEKKTEVVAENEVSHNLKALIREYANGNLSDEALREERTRVIEAYRESHDDDLFGEGVAQVDNILKVAQSVKGAVEHGESIDEILSGMRIIAGHAREGVRSQAKYDAVDKTIEKLTKSRVGSLLSPEVITAAVTTTASLLRLGSTKAVGAAAMTLAPGLGAGLLAGVRERKRVKDERTQHAREMAQGKDFSNGAKRREQMERTRYETKNASDLTTELRSRIEGSVLDEGGDEALRAAIDALSAITTRVNYSDGNGVDLISYSSAHGVGEERMDLDIAIAEAKIATGGRLTPEALIALGLPADATLEMLIEERSSEFFETIENDMSAKDMAFRKLRRRRVAGAASIGVVSGLTLGIASQELGAMISDSRSGLVEQLWRAENKPHDGADHLTLLHGLVDNDGATHTDPSGEYVSSAFGDQGNMSISDDHNIAVQQDGTISLIDPNGVASAENVKINADGSLPQESLDALAQKGFTVEDLSFTEDVVTHETRTVSVDEFIANHPQDVSHVTRDLWYDNNTPAPVFDKNELSLQWDGNQGLNAEGFQMSVASMVAAGSFHGDQAANWSTQAQSGNLKLAISASVDTQSTVFMVDINSDGTINIPQDSPAGQFFATENGQAVFKGQYAEVVQRNGPGVNGVERIRPLATLVGSGDVASLQDTVEVHTPVIHPDYKITSPGYETKTFTEMAPVLPIYSRRPLENLAARRRNTSVYGPSYNGYRGEYGYDDETEQAERERSPRLRNDPNALLNPREELDWYHDEIMRTRPEDVQRMQATIDASRIVQNLPSNFDTVVTLPVYAPAEHLNIYKTLSLYGQQDTESLQDSLVVLNVNWQDADLTDSEKVGNIQKTKDEIERARRDFPGLRIMIFENEYSRAKVTETGGAIGYVSRDLMDSALLIFRDRKMKGVMADDADGMVLRNDADMNGMSHSHLKKMQKMFRNSPETDVFKGMTRFDVRSNERYPGFGIVTDLSNMINVWSTRDGHVHTGGANFATRASTLAAVGGIGEFNEKRGSGTGSDDVGVGRKIAAARGAKTRSTSSLYGSAGTVGYVSTKSSNSSGASRKVIKHVAGANIDTNSDRLLPFYLDGQWYQHAWSGGKGSFSAGASGYSQRDSIKDTMINKIPFDRFGRRGISYEFLETNITGELSLVDAEYQRKALSILFKDTPGAYTLGDNGEFHFTKEGRKYLRKQIGRQGRKYYPRKYRGLYRRNALNKTPALLSPVA